MKVPKAFRIEKGIIDRLSVQAEKEQRSLSNLIEIILGRAVSDFEANNTQKIEEVVR